MLRKNDGIISLKIKNLITQILEKNPNDEGANYILGLYHKQIGDNFEAKKIWNNFLRNLKKSSPWLSIVKEDLKRLKD